jgi:hypothetical protein
MVPTAYKGWRRNMISTAVICANFDDNPTSLLVIPAILYVIPAILQVIPAQAGISARYHDDKPPADAGMTV